MSNLVIRGFEGIHTADEVLETSYRMSSGLCKKNT
jgi:hypothetical protein